MHGCGIVVKTPDPEPVIGGGAGCTGRRARVCGLASVGVVLKRASADPPTCRPCLQHQDWRGDVTVCAARWPAGRLPDERARAWRAAHILGPSVAVIPHSSSLDTFAVPIRLLSLLSTRSSVFRRHGTCGGCLFLAVWSRRFPSSSSPDHLLSLLSGLPFLDSSQFNLCTSISGKSSRLHTHSPHPFTSPRV